MAIKCADQNCKAYIDQVQHSPLCGFASACPASVRMQRWCSQARAARRAHPRETVRKRSRTPGCAMSAPPSPSAAMARGCAGAYRVALSALPSSMMMTHCRIDAPHSALCGPLGYHVRAATMPRSKGGLRTRKRRASTAGPVPRQSTLTPAWRKLSREVCTSARCPELALPSDAHAQTARFSRFTALAHAPLTTPPFEPCLTRGGACFSVPEYNPRPTGGWSHGKGKAKKRLLLHSKRLSPQAEVSCDNTR